MLEVSPTVTIEDGEMMMGWILSGAGLIMIVVELETIVFVPSVAFTLTVNVPIPPKEWRVKLVRPVELLSGLSP